jgi:hypothetical protein
MASTTPTTPIRRAALGAAITAIAAGLAVPACASTRADDDADAELLRLCAEANDCEDLLREIVMRTGRQQRNAKPPLPTGIAYLR